MTQSKFSLRDIVMDDQLLRRVGENPDALNPASYFPFSTMIRHMEPSMTRDLNVTNFTSGGALTGDKVTDSIIPFLRAQSICGRLGATVMTGLVPSEGSPVLTSDFNAQWLAESASATPVDVTTAQVLTTPKRLTCSINISKLLQIQSEADFSVALISEMSKKIFQTLDQAALNGTGGAQPIGILNAAGTGAVTFGGAATWQKILSFENTIGNANADGAAMGWAQSPDARAKWKATQRASGTSTFLQNDDNTVAGYRTAMTTELNTANGGNKCIFGNWSDLAIGIFSNGVFILRNPYTRSDKGEDKLVITLFADVSMRHPQSFVVSEDSAAQ